MLHAFVLAASLLVPLQGGGTPARPAPAPVPQVDPQKEAEKQRELEIHYQDLNDRYARSELEWGDEMRKAAADPELSKIVAAKHPVKEYWTRFEQLANDGSGRALAWMAAQAERKYSDKGEIAQKKILLFRKLIDEHASQPWAMEIVLSISVQRAWIETAVVEQLLEDFAGKTTNRELAATALRRALAVLGGAAGQEVDPQKSAALKERILKEYADTEVGKQLAGQAVPEPAAFAAGMAAPELAGKDVDGAELGLAAARGKVVLLEFWGFWSPQSRALIPHLRELQTRHAADPFLILGVSSDDDAARFRELSKEQAVGWRSVWEGGRNGPIAQRYKVRSYPTLFLIDAQGAILKVWAVAPSEKSLDAEIAQAIAAAKRGAKK